MISPLSSPQSVKEQIGSLVRWGRRLPDYVFTTGGYPYAYFFESPIAGRPDLIRCLITILLRTFHGPVMISIAHDGQDGRFEDGAAPSTLLTCGPDDDVFASIEGAAFFQFIATHPYAGLVCGTNPSTDWVMFEDPTDLVGVLVAKKRIDMSESESDYVFDLARFIKLASGPELDFTKGFIRDISKAYGADSMGSTFRRRGQ